MMQIEAARREHEKLVERAITLLAKLSDRQAEQVIRAASREGIFLSSPDNAKPKYQDTAHLQSLFALWNALLDIEAFMAQTKERSLQPMTNKLASIPEPIEARIDELNALVEKHPQYIPVTAVAAYLGVNPEGLRRCIEAGQCPFGIAWSKSIGGNKAFKIPTLTFYLWVTQCCAFRYTTVSPDFGIDREDIS